MTTSIFPHAQAFAVHQQGASPIAAKRWPSQDESNAARRGNVLPGPFASYPAPEHKPLAVERSTVVECEFVLPGDYGSLYSELLDMIAKDYGGFTVLQSVGGWYSPKDGQHDVATEESVTVKVCVNDADTAERLRLFLVGALSEHTNERWLHFTTRELVSHYSETSANRRV